MKDIPGYKGEYAITRDGQVWSYKKPNGVRPHAGRFLKLQKTARGYFKIMFRDRKRFLVHRLVALTYIPQKPGHIQINHKDGNKTNNSVSNLEWCTPEYNIEHAIRTGLIKTRKTHMEWGVDNCIG